MTKWREVLLDEIADEITVGYVGSMTSEYVDRGVPFLRSLNVKPLRINQENMKFISREFHHQIQKSRLAPGDVVIVRTGKPGACALIPEWLPDANCSDLVIVRCGKQIYNRFLAYYINVMAGGHISTHLVGAVQQHFNVGAARTLSVRLPPLPEQRAIAGVLSSLDDKIDLLHRQNETLEALARTLFRQWFVEEAEDDWEEGALSDIAQHIKENVKPGKFPGTDFYHFSIPSFDDGMYPKKEKGIEIRSNKYRVIHNSILISKLNPRFPRVWAIYGKVPDNSICSTEFQVVFPRKPEFFSFIYCLLKSDHVSNELVGAAGGTSGSHQRVGPQVIFNLKYQVKNLEQISDFHRQVSINWNKVKNNLEQIRTLEKLRDTLLPKLMSGEARIK